MALLDYSEVTLGRRVGDELTITAFRVAQSIGADVPVVAGVPRSDTVTLKTAIVRCAGITIIAVGGVIRAPVLRVAEHQADLTRIVRMGAFIIDTLALDGALLLTAGWRWRQAVRRLPSVTQAKIRGRHRVSLPGSRIHANLAQSTPAAPVRPTPRSNALFAASANSV